jgi:hypothetical protein
MMFVWGGLLLLAFLVPLSTDPMVFSWDTISNAEGTGKLPPLIIAAVGLLSVLLAAIPTSPAPRGMMAALLGLVGIYVPMFLNGMPPWQTLLTVGGATVLIPGLILRSEYRDSIVPRILVTIGVVAILVMFIKPVDDEIPIVGMFKGIIDAPKIEFKLLALIPVLFMVLLVLALLAWLPAPSTGGANVFAWLVMVFPGIVLLLLIAITNAFDHIPKEPGALLAWIHTPVSALGGKGGGRGGAEFAAWFGMILASGYAVLMGYGLATIIGKKLE